MKIIEEPTFNSGSYAWFHFANKGKLFLTPNGLKTKLEVYNEFKNDTASLEKITNGKKSGFESIDKPGWKNGILVSS